MHLVNAGGQQTNGKKACDWKLKCDKDGLLKGPIGLGSIECGDYNKNKEKKMSNLLKTNTAEFDECYKKFNEIRDKEMEANRKEREERREKAPNLEEFRRKLSEKIKLNDAKTVEENSQKVDLTNSESSDSDDLICLDDNNDVRYGGKTPGQIKQEKLAEISIPIDQSTDSVEQNLEKDSNHSQEMPPTPELSPSPTSPSPPLSPTAGDIPGEVPDNDFVRKYGLTFKIHKKYCDRIQDHLSSIAVIIKTPVRNDKFNHEIIFTTDGDNIWKGLMPMEVHRKVEQYSTEINLKCHNGQCDEFVPVDHDTHHERYFNHDDGVIKIAILKSRTEMAERLLLRSNEIKPRRWTGSNTEVYLVFSYKSDIVEDKENRNFNILYDYFDKEIKLEKKHVEKITQFFQYFPKRDEIIGGRIGSSENHEMTENTEDDSMDGDYLDKRAEFNDPFQEPKRKAHRCEANKNKDYEKVLKNKAKNMTQPTDQFKTIKPSTNSHRKRSLIDTSKNVTSKRPKNDKFISDTINRENTSTSQDETVEIQSDEESEKLETKYEKTKIFKNQFLRNLRNECWDELNPKTKFNFIRNLNESLLEDCEVGLSDDNDEDDKSSVKKLIKNTREVLGIKEKRKNNKKKRKE